MTEPTNKELDAVIKHHRTRIYPQDMQPHFERAIMRAVLAKWGQPAQARAASVPKAQFDDPKVQAVYAILCDDAEPPKGEHWEGFAARRIVDALLADSVQEDAARVFTYKNQPCDNVTAWRFGEACRAAQPGGDPIDHGLSLLQKLQERGYGIVAIDAARKQGENHGR